MMSCIGLHKFAGVIFGITQKLLFITPSNLVREYITNKKNFVNLFYNLKRDWFQAPFVFDNFVHWKGQGWKEKAKFAFLKVSDNLLSKYLVFK